MQQAVSTVGFQISSIPYGLYLMNSDLKYNQGISNVRRDSGLKYTPIGASIV